MSEGRDISGHIAIIGMDGRFPGAKNLKQFWENLVSGADSTRELTDEELLLAGESREAIAHPKYVRRSAYLDDTDMFDAQFFGFSPKDAAVMDPQHRLFLEVAWGALEDAGYDSSRCPGSVGVFAGSGMSYYAQYNVFTQRKLVSEMGEWLIRHTANDRNFLATLASYKLNVTGPSMNIQTACSTALVATHVACQSLLGRECDFAIAGGSAINFPQKGYIHQESEILSSDGRCRAFDVHSDGTVFGSGVGAVVLRRLEDAIADGDTIDAVIVGSAINNDGSDKVGFLAPSVGGQAAAIVQALQVAQVDPATVSYIETHGTGTVVGDPIEVLALKQAFHIARVARGGSASRVGYCGIGSVKTNIGHLGEAAGIAGLIKTCLALRHQVIPATLYYTAPNPELGLEGSPFYVVGKNVPWTPGGGPRRAGVTGLGAGGTNAHIILEEAPEALPPLPPTEQEVLLLSAKSEAALVDSIQRLAAHLRETPGLCLADVAFTLREGRHLFPFRRAIYCRDLGEAVRGLDEAASSSAARPAAASAPRITFMFPGGGAQYANMGRDLYESQPVYRAAIDECARYALPSLQADIRTLMYCLPDAEEAVGQRLQSPRLSLPTLFSTSYALAQLLFSWGIQPDAMIGHSMGEYVAACLAGVFSLEDALALVIERGRLFEQVQEGAMLAMPLSPEAATPYMGEGLSFAAINAPELTVASGGVAQILALKGRLNAEEIDSTRVRIRVAAHSSLLDPILPAFRNFCEKIRFRAPTRRFISNLTGELADESAVTSPEYWVRHLRSTVQFASGLRTIFADGPTLLLEIGPGTTLASVARQQKLTPLPPVALPTLRHPKESVSDRAFLFGTLGKMWAAGAQVDWEKNLGESSGARVHLPTYPFQHSRYWIDADRSTQASTELTKRADVGDWFCVPSWQKSPLFVSDVQRSQARQWLVFTDQLGLHGRVRPHLKGRVVSVRRGLAFSRMDADVFEVNPSRSVDFEELLSSLDMDRKSPLEIVYLWPLSLRRSKLYPPSYEELAEASFHGLLSLLQAAGDLDWSIRLTVVTNGAVQVGSERVEPEKALSFGPVRVCARELPHVETRLIDWQYDPIWDRFKTESFKELLDELMSGGQGRVVALRGRERYVESLSKTRLPAAPEGTWPAKPDGTYLITGGFGGIGREVAARLAQLGNPRLILVGRQALPDRGKWKKLAEAGELASGDVARIRQVQDLEAAGATVFVEAVDVAELAQVVTLLQRHPHIDGVFHAAGVLHDAPVQAKTHEEATAVILAKARGADHLLSTLPLAELDFVVLFSSSSSRLGLSGQVDYTAANAMLDALAAQACALGHKNVFSINWGTWRDVGMAARLAGGGGAIGEVLQVSVGHMERPRQEGWWSTPERELMTTGTAWTFQSTLSAESDWLLSEHRIHGGESVVPGTGFVDLVFSALRTLFPTACMSVEDLLFLVPFIVADSTSKTLTLRIVGNNLGGDFEFLSEQQDGPHAAGSYAAIVDFPEAAVDLAQIRARCAKSGALKNGQLIQAFVDFGERWGNLRSLNFGVNEALVGVVLPEKFAGDLVSCVLHPAMLDMATGAAQELMGDFDQQTEFFVPFSYGKIRVRAPLPREIVSHVRLKGRSGETALFDVTLADSSGQVLAFIDSFLMKKVDPRNFSTSTLSAHSDESEHLTDSASLRLRALVRMGTTVDEGMDVLARVIHSGAGPQIFATPVDMDLWVKSTDEDDRNRAGEHAPTFALEQNRVREAPANRMEEELALLWSELLGVSGLGVTDDFFELGGHSLVAARMFVRIRKQYGAALPLSALFASPTIRALAHELDPQGLYRPLPDSGRAEPIAPSAVRTTGWSPIVAIQPRGELPPFFCAPGMGGNPLGQRFLAERMGRNQPFYGLQARGVDGSQDPHTLVEEMAAEYIDAIIKVQQAGPYYLGGFSGGGVVAFEMCHQLTARGETIGLLALLDAYNPLLRASSRAYRMRAHVARTQALGASHAAELLKWKVWEPLKRSGALDLIQGTTRHAEVSHFETERAAQDHKMTSSWIASERRYRPQPYAGSAVLFRSRWDLVYGRTDVLPDPTNGWDSLVLDALEVVNVPGTHDSFLLEPNVRHVADALAPALRKRQDALKPVS